MIVRYPAYYDNFSCIAGACEDTCCAGWEIDIDDETYEAYMKVEGEFGEKLRSLIKEYEFEEDECYEAHGFCLKKNRRCAFLQEDNLCEIYRELGEEALSYVCTNTPRNYLEYGGAREIAVSVSCPEAGRLVFGNDEIVRFVEKEIEEELDFEEDEQELIEAEAIRTMRDTAVELLQNRDLPVNERMSNMLIYSEQMQEKINAMQWAGDYAYAEDVEAASNDGKQYEYFLERMRSFTQLDSINDRWNEELIKLQERYIENENGAVLYGEDAKNFKEYLTKEGHEVWLEQLAVYYAFMCLPRCVDGLNFLGQAQFVAASYLMIEDMALCHFSELKNNFDMETFSSIARIYAKEVEHSEENLDFLADEFLFEDVFSVEILSQSLL